MGGGGSNPGWYGVVEKIRGGRAAELGVNLGDGGEKKDEPNTHTPSRNYLKFMMFCFFNIYIFLIIFTAVTLLVMCGGSLVKHMTQSCNSDI